jgi:hypothetical protein
MRPTDWLVLVAILAAAAVLATWVTAIHLTASRQAKAELVAGQDYRGLADEFRRLSDMAITAHEHVDLRLTDLTVQVDALRDQMDHLQRILKEVE